MVHPAPPSSTGLRIDDRQFDRLSSLIQSRFGIQLPEHKRGLLATRLRKMVVEDGCADFTTFFDRHFADDPSLEVLSRLIDQVSTNHTYFWREPEHLVILRDRVLPELIAGGGQRKDLRLWCAAAATGEEPWALAMLIADATPSGWTGGLLATDISAQALATARRGLYKAENVARLPVDLRERWMTAAPGGTLRVNDRLRAEVTWRRLNLIGAEFPFKAPMDVIFCRNVMIYFGDDTRQDVVRRLARVTRPGGWLFIGHSETLGRADPAWRFERPGAYRRAY